MRVKLLALAVLAALALLALRELVRWSLPWHPETIGDDDIDWLSEFRNDR